MFGLQIGQGIARPRTPAQLAHVNHRNELFVLGLIGGGLLTVLVLIIAGLFGWFESRATAPLPNWAENVLVSIATACALKLGDVLAVLATLATGRQVESFGQQLAVSAPAKPAALPAPDAAAAAEQVADAAVDEAQQIAGDRP